MIATFGTGSLNWYKSWLSASRVAEATTSRMIALRPSASSGPPSSEGSPVLRSTPRNERYLYTESLKASIMSDGGGGPLLLDTKAVEALRDGASSGSMTNRRWCSNSSVRDDLLNIDRGQPLAAPRATSERSRSAAFMPAFRVAPSLRRPKCFAILSGMVRTALT